MMIRTPGGSKQVVGISIRTAGGLKTVKLATIVKDGAAKTIFQTLTATASPTSVSGTTGSYSPANVTTGFTTVSVIGSVGSLSYAWTTPTSGWSADNPTQPTTSFTKTSVPLNTTQTATFTCTVTDSAGGSATVAVGASVRCVNIA